MKDYITGYKCLVGNFLLRELSKNHNYTILIIGSNKVYLLGKRAVLVFWS
jgi:hypothetical protein